MLPGAAVVRLGAGLLLGDDDRRRIGGLDAGGGVQAGVDDDGDPQVPAECSDSTAVMTWRSRASMTSLANWCGTEIRAVSPTTPSSRLSRMNARCWGVTVSSSTPRARSQTWAHSPSPPASRVEAGVHGEVVTGGRAVQLGRRGTGLVGHALVPPGCAKRTVFSSSHAEIRRLGMSVHTVVHSLCI